MEHVDDYMLKDKGIGEVLVVVARYYLELAETKMNLE